ncbi:MAG TPA: hypothetical protein VFM62_01200 [Arthrobacter sp.]|nr:hypothetical protein [Arthrobacter sp.]
MSTQNWPEDTTPRHADGSPVDGTPGVVPPGTTGAGTTGGNYSPPGGNYSQDGGSTKEAAKGEAREVGKEGAEASQHVAGVAKDEARGVAHEAKGQARNLAHELGDDLKGQAGHQQKRVAEGLRSISDELGSMARNSGQNGPATQWVQEASRRTGDMAGWLDQRDPGGLLEETKRFARNRPGAFLAVAAGAGLLAGRLARGMKDNNSDGQGQMDAGHRSAGSPGTYGSTHQVPGGYEPAPPTVPPTSGAATVGGAEGYGTGTGRMGATAREDQAMPDLASTQAPGYSPGFPDRDPRPANPAYPDDDARGLNEGRDKR